MLCVINDVDVLKSHSIIKERVQAEIFFTGNYSLESKFFLFNVTELLVTLVVYGFEQYNVPKDFQPILVPQFLITEDDDTPKFGIGKNYRSMLLEFIFSFFLYFMLRLNIDKINCRVSSTG